MERKIGMVFAQDNCDEEERARSIQS